MLKRFCLILALLPAPALAHFGLILPTTNMLEKDEGGSLEATLAFLHPFEQYGMPMVPPEAMVVAAPDGSVTDLTDTLEPVSLFDEPAFHVDVPVSRPGTYVMGLTPAPYWEPAEDAFIIHYTKTYVAAFGDDTGWDRMLDLPVEIEPLSRPFGLWAGNVFQGVVRAEGEAVPFAEVEVEFWNADAGAEAPSDLMITQTVKADANGVFTYAPPGPGWCAVGSALYAGTGRG